MSNPVTRRQFLLAGAAAGVALSSSHELFASPTHTPERRFYAILSLGRLGFQASFPGVAGASREAWL
jgi:hypothetical protein